MNEITKILITMAVTIVFNRLRILVLEWLGVRA